MAAAGAGEGGGPAAGGEVKLLGEWASSYVTRVKLALHLKGVTEYEYVEEDLRHKSDLLLRSNPVRMAVPVLIHAGRAVCDSRVIVEYIDEVFNGGGGEGEESGRKLLPADPYERARARFWAAYIEEKLVAPWEQAFRARTEEERGEWTEKMAAAVGALEGGLRECSEGKGCFFGGDSVGYVDVVLGGAAAWVHAREVLSGGDKLFDAGKGAPLLAEWLQRFGELDAARAVLPDVGRLVELGRIIHARWAATDNSGS